jgi:hypothetical protein
MLCVGLKLATISLQFFLNSPNEMHNFRSRAKGSNKKLFGV